MLEILIGAWLLVVAAIPKATFHHSGGPGLKPGKPIEPAWIGRLIMLAAGLASLLHGVWRIRHP